MATPFPLVTAGYSCHDFTSQEGWFLTATVPPGLYGQFFVEEGPEFYLEPIAYWCIEINKNGIQSFTPWVPMSQALMVFPAPLGFADNETILRGTPRQGVVLGATRITF